MQGHFIKRTVNLPEDVDAIVDKIVLRAAKKDVHIRAGGDVIRCALTALEHADANLLKLVREKTPYIKSGRPRHENAGELDE